MIEKQIILIECLIIYGLLNNVIFTGKIKKYWVAGIAIVIYGIILACMDKKGSFIIPMLGVTCISYIVMMCDSIKKEFFGC